MSLCNVKRFSQKIHREHDALYLKKIINTFQTSIISDTYKIKCSNHSISSITFHGIRTNTILLTEGSNWKKIQMLRPLKKRKLFKSSKWSTNKMVFNIKICNPFFRVTLCKLTFYLWFSLVHQWEKSLTTLCSDA